MQKDDSTGIHEEQQYRRTFKTEITKKCSKTGKKPELSGFYDP
jgi:hypothetical protein